MSKVIFFIGFVCVLQLASCHVVREAPAPATPITLKDLTTGAETALETLHENVLRFANVSSDAELNALVRTQSETYADKLKDLTNQFADEVKANSGKFEDFFATITSGFTQVTNELKEKNPELATLQENFEKGMKSVLEESQKFRTKIQEDGQEISENAEKILKKVYEDTMETAKTVSEQIAAAGKKD